MVVLNDSETIAAFQTAALQDLPAVGRLHSLPKAVDAQASADLGLVRALGHDKFLLVYYPPSGKLEMRV